MEARRRLNSRIAASAGPGSMRAGVAKSDITNRAEGVTVHDPLFAKALVLDDGRTRLAIVAMDALAMGGIGDIGDEFLPKLRSRIEKELRIPGRNVMVNASHTHPPGRILCPDAELLDRTLDAVRRAQKSMVPVRVGAGAGREDRIAINRTLRLKNGLCWSIRMANPCPPDEIVAGVRPIDPEIGILRVDRLDGRPLAVVYNYGCHLLGGAPEGAITANIPGYASKVIEETLGDGAMALFLQGAGGDVVDVLFKDTARPRDMEQLGVMLGLSTLKGWRRIRARDARLSVASETIKLPRRTDIPERIKELQKEQTELLESLRFTSLNVKSFVPLYVKYVLDPKYPSHYSWRYMQTRGIGSDEYVALDRENRRNIEKYLQNLRAMERLARIQDRIATYRFHKALNDAAGVPTIPAEVQGMKIGDCVFITSPTEALAEVGLNVKKASPYRNTFMAAYSNGYMHYGAPAGDYPKGGYEVTECLLAPEWQKIYEKKANEIIRRLR